MATKYLDSTGVGILWGKTKDYANARKTEVMNLKGAANGFASLDANGNVPLSQLGNIDTTLLIIPADNKLPTTGIKTNKIYLIKENSETNNVYTEYIYVNNAWEILGKFAVKVDLSPYATTQSVNDKLANKVDKVTGKGLSTNDFTTALLTKLNGIADGANKTVVDSALSASSVNPVQNKAVNTALGNKVDKVTGRGLSEQNFTQDEKETLSKISLGNLCNISVDDTDGIILNYYLDNADHTLQYYGKKLILDGVILDIPKRDGTIALNEDIPDISGKVDKVTGKGLSTNDYTTTEKNKLSGIAEGANKTVVDAAISSTSTNPVQNKAIYASISAINTTLGNKLNASDIAAITSTELADILK